VNAGAAGLGSEGKDLMPLIGKAARYILERLGPGQPYLQNLT